MDHSDPTKKLGVVIARIPIENMERSTIWRAAIQNGPPDRKLRLEMARPFMNFKEAREQLSEVLGIEPKKLKFMSFKGSKTFFPDDVQFFQLTVEGSQKKPAGHKFAHID